MRRMAPRHNPQENTTMPRSMRARRLVGTAGLVLVLAACNSERPARSQVALKVNGDEISVHQVDLVVRARAALAAPNAAAESLTQSTLAGLVDQELAAQAARQQGLDRDPQVIQRLEAAKRSVLAQAFQERVGARASDPSSDEIDRYFDAHPELFAQRRLYQLQETIVGVAAERFDVLKRALDGAPSAAQVQEILARERLKSSVRHLSVSAEDLPLGVLPQLAQLKEGGSVTLPRDGGARVLTLLGSQGAPIGRDGARRLIAQYLVNERKRELIAQSIKTLRDDAKVEYLGRHAELDPARHGAAGAQTKR
jgi:EpsD family peptidyl-prolyl cis-trans isomerase